MDSIIEAIANRLRIRGDVFHPCNSQFQLFRPSNTPAGSSRSSGSIPGSSLGSLQNVYWNQKPLRALMSRLADEKSCIANTCMPRDICTAGTDPETNPSGRTVFKNWPPFNGRDRSCGIALSPIAARALRFAPANNVRYRRQETSL